jgi:Arc/MetJ family transcription regulator
VLIHISLVCMRTTLIIPQELMSEAMALTGFQSKTDVVIQCMKEYLRAAKRQKLRDSLDTLRLDLDIAKSRRRPIKRQR